MKGSQRLGRRRRRRGMLTFEWILVLTVLGIGIIGGVAAVRNGVLDEYADTTAAISAVDLGRLESGVSGKSTMTEGAWWESVAGQTPSSVGGD